MPTTTRAEWEAWGLAVSVVVAEPGDVERATRIVTTVMAEVDEACSRFRPDSELSRLSRRLPGGVAVSPLLAELVASALDAAEQTGGDVDPTLGLDLIALGYDRDFSHVAGAAHTDSATGGVSVMTERRPGWTRVVLDDGVLTVPADLLLDLGATAKAWAADRAAERVASTLGVGTLVSMGGDIATAGDVEGSGWEILVQDSPADPSQRISLSAGCGIATSSTQKRRWQKDGRALHHILDPRLGMPADPVWRSVTVASENCLRANMLSTASIVRGFGAVAWLEAMNVSARFVDSAGRVVTTSGWPAPVDALDGPGSGDV
jgi:thiamine biosynthesis lipoprotein